jgi:hypothetical protein
MRTSIVVGMLVVTLVGGCGTVGGAPESVARGLGPSLSPTPSAPPFDREALANRVKKAMMPAGALIAAGGPTNIEAEAFDTSDKTSEHCNLIVLGVGTYTHVSHRRKWANRAMTVYQNGHGYGNMTGAAAVDATRRNAQNCQSYEYRYSDGIVKFDLLGVVELGQVPGADGSFALCEKHTYEKYPVAFGCVAYLSRGSLLSVLTVFSGETAASSQAKLLQIVPIAAAALAAG